MSAHGSTQNTERSFILWHLSASVWCRIFHNERKHRRPSHSTEVKCADRISARL
jgi:hypothetical protein